MLSSASILSTVNLNSCGKKIYNKTSERNVCNQNDVKAHKRFALLQVIPAAIFNCRAPNVSVVSVVYAFNYDAKNSEFLGVLQVTRRRICVARADRLPRHCFDRFEKGVSEHRQGSSSGRPHYQGVFVPSTCVKELDERLKHSGLQG